MRHIFLKFIAVGVFALPSVGVASPSVCALVFQPVPAAAPHLKNQTLEPNLISILFDLAQPHDRESIAFLEDIAYPNVDPLTQRHRRVFVPKSIEKFIPDPYTNDLKDIVDSAQFYSSVYDHYGTKFPETLIRKLSVIDDSLELSRTSRGVIRGKSNVYGTWRIFDATVAGSDRELVKLPYMRLNHARKIKQLKIDLVLNKLLRSGITVKEIGKFTANAENPETRSRVTKLIELNWSLSAREDSVYIAHVTSVAHARLYRKYGFKVAEEFSTPDGNREAILWVLQKQFKSALLTQLSLPSPH